MLQKAPPITGSSPGIRNHLPGGLRRRLSIVLLTYNCARWLPATLDHIEDLGVPVIAVDNGSTDGTVEVLKGRNLTRVITLARNRGAAARNAGVAASSTPYVAFCDDDGWYEPEGLALAADLLDAHPRLAAVNARILLGSAQRLAPVCAEMAASPLSGVRGVPGKVLLSLVAGAAVIRRAAFDAVGGYDARFLVGGEGETLAIPLARHGWQIRYAPQVVVHHYPSGADAARIGHHRVRNTIINAWLHRPLLAALCWTWFILRSTPSHRQALGGLLLALGRLGWIVHERSVMDRQLGCMLSILDDRRRAAATTRRRDRAAGPGRPDSTAHHA